MVLEYSSITSPALILRRITCLAHRMEFASGPGAHTRRLTLLAAPPVHCSISERSQPIAREFGPPSRTAAGKSPVCPNSRADGQVGPRLRPYDDHRVAIHGSVTPIVTAHRREIAQTPKSPTFLPFSPVNVTQSNAVSLNLVSSTNVSSYDASSPAFCASAHASDQVNSAYALPLQYVFS